MPGSFPLQAASRITKRNTIVRGVNLFIIDTLSLVIDLDGVMGIMTKRRAVAMQEL
jgi:hypothetical protein